MKSSFALLALTASPWLLSAQGQAQPAPIRIAKASAEPLPPAQELFDNLLAPYEAAKTFRGQFDISIKAQENAIAEIHLETRFRYDDKNNLRGQWSRMKVVGRAKPKTQQTFLFVGDGQTQKVVLVEQKVWWNVAKRDNAATFFSVVKPLIDQVVQALQNNEDFTPVVSRATDDGRAVFVLKSNKSKIFRATLDAQTCAIRSLSVKDTISLNATDQIFDGPLADQELAWVAPADFRQVAPGEVAPPAALGITIPGFAGEDGTAN